MDKSRSKINQSKLIWILIIILLTISISLLHYRTPTMKWQYHLLFMQSYFIPILLAAFQFGIRGGVWSSLAVTILYFPHIMLQWGGFTEENLIRFLQIILFNVIGYITGFKAQREMEENQRLQSMTKELDNKYLELKIQSEKLVELEEQLRHADRLAVIGELSASLAHEVRNPLGAIRGAVEIIRDETASDSKQFEFANILIEETKRLNNVVENYLSFAGKSKKVESIFSIIEVIQNSILLLSNQAKKNGIIIETQMPASSLTLKGDSNELRQVLINLILNAIESISNNGEVTVKVEEKNESEEQNIIISVIDTGKGISEEKISQIFQPFYTTKKNGSGLGLAIIKRICDSNGWKISINQIENGGSEFQIIIPNSNKMTN